MLITGITDWLTPTKVKEVQSFLGFCNFYRRFIKDYSKIAKSLFKLTQKEHSWDWMLACEEAFQILKKTFIESLVLIMLDTRNPFHIECDASNFATRAVLSQVAPDGKWHPCAYISKLLSPMECNYPIYDKELLAIVRAFEAWQHYLEGTENLVDVWMDHKNLEWFHSSQKLNHWQARWSLFLLHFDYKLMHKVGVTNKSDGLSWHPDHKEGVEFDNSGEMLLDPKLFNKTKKTVQRPFVEINKLITEDKMDPHQVFHIRATR